MTHDSLCRRVLEWHVVYDKRVERYRAQLRCGCGTDKKTSRKAYMWVASAEREARQWLVDVMRQRETERVSEMSKDWSVRDV